MADSNTLNQGQPNFETGSGMAKNIAAIVLAAGSSQRMGNANKLLLNIEGQTLLQRCVTTIIKAGVGEVVVVLGHESKYTKLHVVELGVRCVINTEYKAGQTSSVQCGLSALSGDSRAAMICLADQPFINATHLQQLISAYESLPNDKQIVVPVYKKQRGNPVLISESVRKEVVHQGVNFGCRKYIDDNPDKVFWLSVSDSAFTTDIDTPEDYLGGCPRIS